MEIERQTKRQTDERKLEDAENKKSRERERERERERGRERERERYAKEVRGSAPRHIKLASQKISLLHFLAHGLMGKNKLLPMVWPTDGLESRKSIFLFLTSPILA